MVRYRGPAAEVPHSWDLENWPDYVYPHTTSRARYLVRTYRGEFLRDGVMARVGRELVVFGARYAKWLERRAALVPDYELAPNRKDAASGVGANCQSPNVTRARPGKGELSDGHKQQDHKQHDNSTATPPAAST